MDDHCPAHPYQSCPSGTVHQRASSLRQRLNTWSSATINRWDDFDEPVVKVLGFCGASKYQLSSWNSIWRRAGCSRQNFIPFLLRALFMELNAARFLAGPAQMSGYTLSSEPSQSSLCCLPHLMTFSWSWKRRNLMMKAPGLPARSYDEPAQSPEGC